MSSRARGLIAVVFVLAVVLAVSLVRVSPTVSSNSGVSAGSGSSATVPLVSRSYTIDPDALAHLLTMDVAVGGTPEEKLQAAATSLGVSFSAGSHFKLDPVSSELHAINSLENLLLFEQVFLELLIIERKVSVAVRCLEFARSDIDALLGRSGIKAVVAEDLLQLETDNRARVLNAEQVILDAGSRVTNGAVRVVVYPTEFSNGEPEQLQVDPNRAVPLGYDSEELGATLTVDAAISADATAIRLNLSTELVEHLRWVEYGKTVAGPNTGYPKGTVSQPLFQRESVTSTASLRAGETIVLGGSLRAEDPTTYFFVMVRTALVTPQGALLGSGERAYSRLRQTAVWKEGGIVAVVFPQNDELRLLLAKAYGVTGPKSEEQMRDSRDCAEALNVLGVDWPEGAFIHHNPVSGTLIVASTREDLSRLWGLHHFLEKDRDSPQYRVTQETLAFPRKAIEVLSRGRAGDRIGQEDIRRLFQSGVGRVFARYQLWAENDSDAEVQSVLEVRYPEEFDVSESFSAHSW